MSKKESESVGVGAGAGRILLATSDYIRHGVHIRSVYIRQFQLHRVNTVPSGGFHFPTFSIFRVSAVILTRLSMMKNKE